MSGRTTPLPRWFKRAFIVLVLAGIALNSYLVWSEHRELARGYADFTIFYSAADIVRSGHANALYNEQAQYRAQLAIAPDLRSRGAALPYNHPPFEVLLFLPLSRLPYLPAYVVWILLNLAMLFAGIWLLREFPVPSNATSTTKAFLLASVFFPAFATMFKGQDLIVLFLIVGASYALLKRGSDPLAGFVLGLGTFRPELSLPIAVVIGYVRGKRFVAGFVISAALAALLSGAVVGWHSLLSYPAYVFRMERVFGRGSIVPADMPNLRGLISLLLHYDRIAFVLTILGSVVVLVFALRFARAAHELETELSIAILSALLISYHALVHDLTLLLVPIIFMCDRHADPLSEIFGMREDWLLASSTAFFLCTPLLVWLWLGIGRFGLVALVLSIWLWRISQAKHTAPAGLRALRAEQT